jgi:hypothetical protein
MEDARKVGTTDGLGMSAFNPNDDLALTQLGVALCKLAGRRGEAVYDEAVKLIRRWLLEEAKTEISHINAQAAQLDGRGEKV